MYRLERDPSGRICGILRVQGGACIPVSPDNVDYAQYLAWVTDGNTAEEDTDFALKRVQLWKIEEIDQARLAANRSTFAHDGREFSCDDLARSDIDGTTNTVLLTGQFPQPWPGFWRATDGSEYQITTVDEWRAFYASMGAAGAVNFAKSYALKTAVAAAATPEEVRAIQWDSALS